MAHDHCCINYCNNDKQNESGKNLSFFNFPSNSSQRSQWIAAIKRDEGPLFEVSVPSSRAGVTCRRLFTFHFRLSCLAHVLLMKHGRNTYPEKLQSIIRINQSFYIRYFAAFGPSCQTHVVLVCLFSFIRIWLSVFNEILPCYQHFKLLLSNCQERLLLCALLTSSQAICMKL